MAANLWDKIIYHYEENSQFDPRLNAMRTLAMQLKERFQAVDLKPFTSHDTLKFYGETRESYLLINLRSVQPTLFNITLIVEDQTPQSQDVAFDEALVVIEACLQVLKLL